MTEHSQPLHGDKHAGMYPPISAVLIGAGGGMRDLRQVEPQKRAACLEDTNDGAPQGELRRSRRHKLLGTSMAYRLVRSSPSEVLERVTETRKTLTCHAGPDDRCPGRFDEWPIDLDRLQR